MIPNINPDTGEFDPLTLPEPVPTPVLRAAAMNGVFNYDTRAASIASGVDFTHSPSLTQQQFRDEVDINTIVRNFGLTGQLPEQGAYPAFGDFDTVSDYQTALNIVRAADEAFMALPGHVRARFSNDPQLLMEFCADDDNLPEARKLGLTRTLTEAVKPVVPEPKAQVGLPAQPGTVTPAGTVL